MRDEFHPFTEYRVDDFLRRTGDDAAAAVARLPESSLATANEVELSDRLADAHALVVPTLAFGKMTVRESTRMVPAEQFPRFYAVQPGKSYERKTFIFQIPYAGDAHLLRCWDTTRCVSAVQSCFLEGGQLCFEVRPLEPTTEIVLRDRDAALAHLRRYLPDIASSVEMFNRGLSGRLLSAIQQRKKQMHEAATLLASLGTPVASSSTPPPSMSITPPTRRRLGDAGTVRGAPARAPDPSLDAETYEEILRVLSKQAHAMERAPASFAQSGEEDIRNRLVVGLEAAFDFAVSAETFNMSGKTDILLRHDGRNLFVAECKIWKGERSYMNAISQLLGYLTWRDSKAAVLLFVRNRDLKQVIATVDSATPKHSGFLEVIEQQAHGASRYRFQLPNTDGVVATVAILLFHLPTP